MQKQHHLTAYKLTSDIQITDLHNAAWSYAGEARLDHYWSGQPAPKERHSEASLLWSENALFIRFLCNQHEPLVVSDSPNLDSKTRGLWERDVCEIFLATDPKDPSTYFEFEGAPTGEWLDLRIEHKEERITDWDYSSGMSVYAVIDEGTVQITMRIPWSGLGKRPNPGDKWLLNLFRCVGRGESRGYLAWSPTYTAEPNFHVYEAFGWIQF
jgi:alpha-galactosidase